MAVRAPRRSGNRTSGVDNAPLSAPEGKVGWWCRVPGCGQWGFVEPGEAGAAANRHTTNDHPVDRARGA